MSKPQDQAATTSGATTRAPAGDKDYAAWIDREGCEHLITRDMVDSMIEELVAGPDYSLQGRRLQGRGGFPSRA